MTRTVSEDRLSEQKNSKKTGRIMAEFKAFWVEKQGEAVTHSMISRQTDELPEGELLIRVHYSSVNYKDALSVLGKPGVTRKYPHTPGIDAAGVVVDSSAPGFAKGDEVISIGFDLGMNTPGGFGEYIRVPAGWALPCPPGLDLRTAMIFGTAGLTAALCLQKLQQADMRPESGPLLVTGATGGVGSLAVAILAGAGFEVAACTGKQGEEAYLKALGAARVLGRAELALPDAKPLGPEIWAGGLDTVGGQLLASLLKSLKYGGSVAACGLAASPQLSLTVLPFILRSVNLLGIDSVELPLADKAAAWQRLAGDWRPAGLESLVREIRPEAIPDTARQLLDGSVRGRTLVRLI